jgi:hypothetical protein
MSLHFAKYAGKFVIAKQNQDRGLLKATLIDTFIILLATANIFNKRVSAFSCIAETSEKNELKDIGKFISRTYDVNTEGVFSFIADTVTIEAGKVAKAVESLDHLESYAYAEVILNSLDKILEVCIVAAFFSSTDLESEVRERLRNVEKKSIFHDELRPENDNHLIHNK